MPRGTIVRKRKNQEETDYEPSSHENSSRKKRRPHSSARAPLRQLHDKTEADLTRIRQRLRDSKCLLLENQEERCQMLSEVENSLTKLNQLRTRGKSLMEDIGAAEVLFKHKLSKLPFNKQQRLATDPMRLSDLPNELIAFIFLYLGYPNQQRLVRVCGRWRHILTAHLDHLYISDTEMSNYHFRIHTGPNGHRLGSKFHEEFGKIDGAHPESSPAWKYKCQSVTLLTVFFHLESADCSLLYLRTVLKRFPRLWRLNFSEVELSLNSHSLIDLMESHPQIEFRFADSVARRCPALHDLDLTALHADVRRVLDKNKYVNIPWFVFTSDLEYSRMLGESVWNYSEIQLDWLAVSAPYLNKKPRLVRDLDRVIEELGTWIGLKAQNVKCKVHDQMFCHHLDASFYENLHGQIRLLIALCILRLKNPRIESAPENFSFYKRDYTGKVGVMKMILDVKQGVDESR